MWSSLSGEILLTSCEVRKPSKEVQKRDASFQRCGLGDQCEVVSFLDRRRTEHRESGGTSRHHVAVISEDRKRVRGKATGRDVNHRWSQFSSDLEHVGDHEQQSL